MWRPLTSLCSVLVLVACAQAPDPQPMDEVRIRASTLLSEDASAASNDHAFTPATRGRTIRFPGDHASHPSFRQEWWYWTCVLWRDQAGEIPRGTPAEFGAQLVFFRRALKPEADPQGWRATQIYMNHFAMTHVEANLHRSTEVLSRQIPDLAEVQGEPFVIRMPGSLVRSLGKGFAPLEMRARAQDYSMDLELEATEPIVLQGEDGYSAKSKDAASHYYSLPRLKVRGEVGWDGSPVDVIGWAWLDREWSSRELPRGLVGWDWMALMLADGSELMLYQLVRDDGSKDPFNYAVYIDSSGTRRNFKSHEFVMVARKQVEFEGDTYATLWRISLDEIGDFYVEAAVENQYLDTTVRYWEGLVRVTDREGRHLGDGYLEMTR